MNGRSVCFIVIFVLCAGYSMGAEVGERTSQNVVGQIDAIIKSDCRIYAGEVQSSEFGKKILNCVGTIGDTLIALTPNLFASRSIDPQLFLVRFHYMQKFEQATGLEEEERYNYCVTVVSESLRTNKRSTTVACAYTRKGVGLQFSACIWIQNACTTKPKSEAFKAGAVYWLDEEQTLSLTVEVNQDADIISVRILDIESNVSVSVTRA